LISLREALFCASGTTCGKHFLQLMNFDFSIAVNIECSESNHEIIFAKQFLVVNSRSVELLKINGTVSIKITVLKDGLPFIFAEGETWKLFLGGFEFINCYVTIIVCIYLIELNLKVFQVFFVRF
jgi:hypothetical protein